MSHKGDFALDFGHLIREKFVLKLGLGCSIYLWISHLCYHIVCFVVKREKDLKINK